MLPIETIQSIIDSIIDDRYEDTKQNVWVAILELNHPTIDEITNITRLIHNKERYDEISHKKTLVSLDKPLIDGLPYSLADNISNEDYEYSLLKQSPIQYKNSQAKQRRYKYKSKHLCIICGKPAKDNYSKCDYCLKYAREYQKQNQHKKIAYHADRRNYFREHGVCVVCGRPRKSGVNQRGELYLRCEHCLEMARKHAKLTHAKHPRLSSNARVCKLRRISLFPKMLELYKQGYSYNKIGETLHLGHMTVYRYKELLNSYN